MLSNLSVTSYTDVQQISNESGKPIVEPCSSLVTRLLFWEIY